MGGSSIRSKKFSIRTEKFQIFRKNFSFSRHKFLTTFLFSPQLKKRKKFALNSPFSGNIHLSHKKRCSLANVSYKKTFSNMLSVQNTLVFSETRPRPPCPKSGGHDPPNPPGLTPLVRLI